jgi:asparagine synthase (glutamine-hydrolysing)
MVRVLHHRGPDNRGTWIDREGGAGLGHTRLSILDLSSAGHNPMSSPDGRYWIVFNGEIYNYRELRSELHEYRFRSQTDTEVALAGYQQWGEACLDRFIGMFAFIIWDRETRSAFVARDRFGVKPLYVAELSSDAFAVASEIKALHAAGLRRDFDEVAWATYLKTGVHEQAGRSFWAGAKPLPAGHLMTWQDATASSRRWYDLARRTGSDFDTRSVEVVAEEYTALLRESVAFRFRSDVPVGINLSGGLDSSILLGLVQTTQGPDSDVKAFTFATGDPHYDELPWVRQMLERTRHLSVVATLRPEEVPALADSVQKYQEEPYGGLPTLAYAKLFERARELGTIVLLDGQGLDEQWAGYDYYEAVPSAFGDGIIQGSKDSPVRPHCLKPEFIAKAEETRSATPYGDRLRNLQYRDLCDTKIPRALRFNDRVSMRSSTELREPFLDHRLVELALRQPADRKIRDGVRKWMLRRMAARLLPRDVAGAPKRPLQTPQREWLRGPLASWAADCIERAIARFGGTWLDSEAVKAEWIAYREGKGDNSFFVWQWICLSCS